MVKSARFLMLNLMSSDTGKQNSVRTKTAQRLYRKKDVQELLTIKNLLYAQRFTIDGAKKQLQKLRNNEEPENKDNEKQKLFLMRIKQELQQIKEMMS